MRNITVRLVEMLIEKLESEADERGKIQSENICNTFATHHEHAEYEQQLSKYEQRIKKLETENERLRSEKRLIIEQHEENAELGQYVEEERSWHEDELFTRMGWWTFGKAK